MTLEQLVLQVLSHEHPTKDIFLQAKKDYWRINKISGFPSNMQILQVYRDLVKAWIVPESKTFQELLKKRAIRSQSGIVSVQVLTKPFWCPGKCIFCPNDFTMPKSYINTEPGAMRALLNNFDPIKQVYNRLLSLTLTGHDTDKIEMIVLGGTRDVYPKEYKERFIKWLYHACNTFPDFLKTVKLTTNANKSLFAIEDAEIASSWGASSWSVAESGSQKKLWDSSTSPEWHQWRIEDSIQSLISKADTISTKKKEVRDTDLGDPIVTNETAEHRMIWLTLETRPEYVTDENCQFWRELGVTRLEMGIQSTNNEVLDMNKRGHDVDCCKRACHKMRQYGFKFSVHLMPGLYGSDENKDLQTFVDIYSDDHFKPDEIKFYPTSVIPNTELYELYKKGEYKPIETDAIKRIITNTFRDIIPPYTRIKRLIRDIPSTEIAAGSSITNLAQLMHEWLYKERKWTDTIKKIYARLYENAQYYETVEEFFNTLSSERSEVIT
jgi:elongator complex protein 3